MQALTQTNVQSLQWKQVSLGGRIYELSAGDGSGNSIVASLYCRTRPGELTRAEAAGREWVFQREGYISSPQVAILAVRANEGAVVKREAATVEATATAPAPEEVGSYKSGPRSSGVLRMRDGREFVWARTGRWRSSGTFTSESGDVLFNLKWKPGAFRAGAGVEIVEAISKVDIDTLLLLVIVGWYLMRLKADDDAIAAGAAAAAIASTSA